MMPNPELDIKRIAGFLKSNESFTFIRFSDGEIEVLKNRALEIVNGKTLFRGRKFLNKFPDYDKKIFDPLTHKEIRKDLMASAMYRNENYIKGVPASHNNALIDREFLVRLNGGMTKEISFSDLFLNSNYQYYIEKIVPLFSKYEHLYIVCNYRGLPNALLSHAVKIEVPDNFFENYSDVKNRVFNELKDIESGALVLSSASSLSNVLGYELFNARRDVTFIDVGTSINHLLSLDSHTRCYHSMNSSFLKKIKYMFSKGYKIKW